ncbi:ABC transporter substrate-binding protein [Bacillus swezeyi]|nr:ABC transporter substrate-binding protein [Bacillus swezeyi]MEC1261998.1 ABC transporter substrate-binding protein [Bacillus swezeyi]MED1741451.1 ABC transporter substrate-binding protein [Bacillus swezeyi]MED2930570.1 ABC transporter substrate-binding protein [Bacillus swezeyi]MED2944540.1 ABC transporter substrate-binding protein [Bacillus swezeyi]MED2963889.1 ABC transporter substrate-binding protein [Bacillus swezeyi]
MKRFFFTILSFTLMLFILASCGGQKTEKVRLAEVTRSVFYTPLYIALSEGFFKEEGIEVDLKTTWGGDKTMTALLSNGVDIALIGSETSIYVNAQGASDPVINFAQLTQTDGTFLVSRDKTDEFSWDQLKNKTFLGQRKGGMPQMAGEFVLKQKGIDPKKDVNLIQTIDFANIPNSFASGTGDYVQLFEPQASIFEKEGIGRIVASFGKESGRIPYTTFMAKESYLKKNAETTEKFTRAIYKAQNWVESHSSKEAAASIQDYFKDTELSIIESSIERYKQQQSFALNPVLDEEEWNQLQAIMDEAGELPKQTSHQELVNTKIAEKVTKNH